MTEARVGQAGVETLQSASPDVQVSQSGAETLFRVTPGVEASQAGVEVLFRVLASYRVSQAGVEVLYKHRPCDTSWCQIWTIERSDGTMLRFTSLDRDLVDRGDTYRSCASLLPSASESIAEIGGAGSMDLTGLLASGAVTQGDLHAGLYDGATVEAWLVPWNGPGDRKLLMRGSFGVVEYSENDFTVEIQGDGAKLEQTPLINVTQPNCRWRFCDANCGKDPAPITVSGTVESGAGQRGFTDSTRAEAAGYFSRGVVTFTSGNNAGISADIKTHGAGGVFTLWPRLQFPILAGDTYDMLPGCTNQQGAADGTNGCDAWVNFVNYGGEPSVPGRDRTRQQPDVRKF
ncbi:DUF2163 domain-containing protein [Erythrobacter sp. HA6-11]